MLRTLALLLAIFLTLGSAHEAEAGGGRVLAVLSSDNAFYRKFLEDYRKHLPAGIEVGEAPIAETLGAQDLGRADVVLSIGSAAARRVRQAATAAPVVYAMVQRRQFDELLRDASRHDRAVFIDPSWQLQAEMARLVLPELRSVGVVYSNESKPEFNELAKAFKSRGIAVASAQVDAPGKLYDALQDVLSKSDVLLAIHDAAIYNPASIRNILLTSFRYGKPMIGLSGAYVRAGALYSLSPTPDGMAAESAALTQSLLGLTVPPARDRLEAMSVDINRDVARTLGFEIPTEDTLKAQLRLRLERNP